MLASTLVALVVALPSATPLEVDKAVDTVLASDRYQTELPSKRSIWRSFKGSGGGANVFGGTPKSDGVLGDPDRSLDKTRGARDSKKNDGQARDGKTDDDGRPAQSSQSWRGGDDGQVRWRSDPRDSRASPAPRTTDRSENIVAVVLWILGIGLAALIVVVVVMLLLERFKTRSEPAATDVEVVDDEPPSDDPVAVKVAAPELSAVDLLAARGDYSAAARELLRVAFDAASTQLKSSIPRDSTSRELLVGLPLPDRQREVLRRIVNAVELGYFGQRPLQKSTFERCREAFAVFEAGFERPAARMGAKGTVG